MNENLRKLQKEVRNESPIEAKRRGLQIQAECDMLEGFYEEYRAGRHLVESVDLEREWAIDLV